MESVAYVDHLIKEYLIYRGYVKTFTAFTSEKLHDKIDEPNVDAITESLLSAVRFQDHVTLQAIWDALESRALCHLPPNCTSSANTVLRALQRTLLMCAALSGNTRCIFDFFAARGAELVRNKGLGWEIWFTLPYVADPHTHPAFAPYATRGWGLTLATTVRNFISSVFAVVPLPKLLTVDTDRRDQRFTIAESKALRTENAQLRVELAAVHALLQRIHDRGVRILSSPMDTISKSASDDSPPPQSHSHAIEALEQELMTELKDAISRIRQLNESLAAGKKPDESLSAGQEQQAGVSAGEGKTPTEATTPTDVQVSDNTIRTVLKLPDDHVDAGKPSRSLSATTRSAHPREPKLAFTEVVPGGVGSAVSQVHFDPSGNKLATVGSCGLVRIFQLSQDVLTLANEATEKNRKMWQTAKVERNFGFGGPLEVADSSDEHEEDGDDGGASKHTEIGVSKSLEIEDASSSPALETILRDEIQAIKLSINEPEVALRAIREAKAARMKRVVVPPLLTPIHPIHSSTLVCEPNTALVTSLKNRQQQLQAAQQQQPPVSEMKSQPVKRGSNPGLIRSQPSFSLDTGAVTWDRWEGNLLLLGSSGGPIGFANNPVSSQSSTATNSASAVTANAVPGAVVRVFSVERNRAIKDIILDTPPELSRVVSIAPFSHSAKFIAATASPLHAQTVLGGMGSVVMVDVNTGSTVLNLPLSSPMKIAPLGENCGPLLEAQILRHYSRIASSTRAVTTAAITPPKITQSLKPNTMKIVNAKQSSKGTKLTIAVRRGALPPMSMAAAAHSGSIGVSALRKSSEITTHANDVLEALTELEQIDAEIANLQSQAHQSDDENESAETDSSDSEDSDSDVPRRARSPGRAISKPPSVNMSVEARTPTRTRDSQASAIAAMFQAAFDHGVGGTGIKDVNFCDAQPLTQVNWCQVNQNENMVLLACADGFVRLCDVRSGRSLVAWQGHQAQCTRAIFSPDEMSVLSLGIDGTVQVRTLHRPGVALHSFSTVTSHPSGVASALSYIAAGGLGDRPASLPYFGFDSDAHRSRVETALATWQLFGDVTTDSDLRFIAAAPPRDFQSVLQSDFAADDIIPDDASPAKDISFYLYGMVSRQAFAIRNWGHVGPVTDLSWHPDLDLIATASADFTVRLSIPDLRYTW